MIVNHMGKMVGETLGDTYISHRDKSKHFFRIFIGYGISSKVIDVLYDQGIRKIVIVEDNKRKFHSNIHDWFRADKWIDNSNDANDEQLILNINKMVSTAGEK